MQTRIFLFLLITHLPLFSQIDYVKPVSKIKISEFDMHAGNALLDNENILPEDFKKLAPQSALFQNDLTDYQSSSLNTTLGTGIYSFGVGILFSDKSKTFYKPNPLLRFGIVCFSGMAMNTRLSKKESRDTAFIQGGNAFYVDTVTSQNYDMNYMSQQIRIDGSLIFRTNSQARWCLFGGIGITGGISFNAFTTIEYSESVEIQTQSNGTNTSSYEDNFLKEERFRNKTNFGCSVYVPLGLDFRIGKKREFWKLLHLFYEAKPTLNFTTVPELRTFVNVAFLHGIGIKVCWN
jgi:hypothetical protein